MRRERVGMRTGMRACVLALLTMASAMAQQAPETPPTPQAMAPFDLTGNWVSIITEDWRWRMLMPAKGDYASVPVSEEGKRIADLWDPANLATDGCKAYGGAAIMRVPTRLRIAWADDSTLRIETDAGLQTRLLRFDGEPPATRSRQGYSAAQWENIPTPGGLGVSLQRATGRMGALQVMTTNLEAGYLRKNGVPYSEQATMTEFFDRFSAFGDEWLTVLSIVEDPLYLNQPFITSAHFKREPDGSKWMPKACE